MSASLAGRRILIAEDLYIVAVTVTETLKQAGAEPVGPFATCADCLAAIATHRIDAAILDIGLAGGLVFPVARELADRGVPFLFLTGYEREIVPRTFAGAPLLAKPVSGDVLCRRIAGLLGGPAPHPAH